jgi:hypothetical protein
MENLGVIVQPQSQNDNLCLFFAAYNCLSSYVERYAFSAGNMANPSKAFTDLIGVRREGEEAKKEKCKLADMSKRQRKNAMKRANKLAAMDPTDKRSFLKDEKSQSTSYTISDLIYYMKYLVERGFLRDFRISGLQNHCLTDIMYRTHNPEIDRHWLMYCYSNESQLVPLMLKRMENRHNTFVKKNGREPEWKDQVALAEEAARDGLEKRNAKCIPHGVGVRCRADAAGLPVLELVDSAKKIARPVTPANLYRSIVHAYRYTSFKIFCP